MPSPSMYGGPAVFQALFGALGIQQLTKQTEVPVLTELQFQPVSGRASRAAGGRGGGKSPFCLVRGRTVLWVGLQKARGCPGGRHGAQELSGCNFYWEMKRRGGKASWVGLNRPPQPSHVSGPGLRMHLLPAAHTQPPWAGGTAGGAAPVCRPQPQHPVPTQAQLCQRPAPVLQGVVEACLVQLQRQPGWQGRVASPGLATERRGHSTQPRDCAPQLVPEAGCWSP